MDTSKRSPHQLITSTVASIGICTFSNWYRRQLQDNPLATKCFTSGILSGLSDMICQIVCNSMMKETEGRAFRSPSVTLRDIFSDYYDSDTWNQIVNLCPYDGDKTANQSRKSSFNIHFGSLLRQALIGYFIRAPLAHYWFRILDKMFVNWACNSVKTAIVKVICEQCIYGPFISLINFWVTGLAEHKSPSEVQQMIRESFWKVWRANAVVWSCVGLITYRFVPIDLRTLFCNVVSLIWGAYVISQTSFAHKTSKIINENIKKSLESISSGSSPVSD